MAKEITAPGELMEMVNAFRTSRIILSAYELDIFTFIKDRKLTSIEIAEAMKMNRRSTDRFMNDDRPEPVVGAIFALNMLVGTQHGDTYTENEVISWMLDTGLKDISVKVSSQGTNLLIGVK